MYLSAKETILAWLMQKIVQAKEHRQEIWKASSLGDTRS